MKVYHLCSKSHENCCDSKLFASWESLLASLTEIDPEASQHMWPASEPRLWYTSIRDPETVYTYDGKTYGENFTITEVEVLP